MSSVSASFFGNRRREDVFVVIDEIDEEHRWVATDTPVSILGRQMVSTTISLN